jgi:DNA-binding NtrC family response regulator
MADKILVIDDASVIRNFLKEVLTDCGFEVDCVANGRDGLDLLDKNEYAIVFCDVHMPILNGVQTVKEIRKSNPFLPVIMTDSFPEKEAEEAARIGAIRCLAKPFDLHELKTAIDSALKNKVGSHR